MSQRLKGKRVLVTAAGQGIGLASALAMADEGAEVFYEGEIAELIAADMQANGGLLSLADLKSYETVRSEPLWGDYRGYRLSTNRVAFECFAGS